MTERGLGIFSCGDWLIRTTLYAFQYAGSIANGVIVSGDCNNMREVLEVSSLICTLYYLSNDIIIGFLETVEGLQVLPPQFKENRRKR